MILSLSFLFKLGPITFYKFKSADGVHISNKYKKTAAEQQRFAAVFLRLMVSFNPAYAEKASCGRLLFRQAHC